MILYSTATCPKCKVVKMKLDKAGIHYEVNENIEQMEALGIRSLPMAQIEGQLLDFPEIIAYLKSKGV